MTTDDELERRGEVAALWLLLLGGFILPVLGWIIGVVILWASERWTRHDKLIGTFVIPGGLLPPLWVFGYYYLGAGWGLCSRTNCEYQMSGSVPAILVIGLTLCSIGTILYLERRRHRSGFSPSRA